MISKTVAKQRLAELYVEQSRIEREIADALNAINPRKRSVAKCGTDSGYFRHVRTLNEPPCRACKQAHADYERAAHHRRAALKPAA